MESEAERNLTVVEICSACMPNLTGVDSTFLSSSADLRGKTSVFADGKPDPYTVVKLTRDKRNGAGDLVMDQIGVTRRCESKTDTVAPAFRFHADLGVEASDDQVLVVEVWDYDTFSADDFLGVAIVRIGDLLESPKLFQLFGGKVENGGGSPPKAFKPDWLSKEAELSVDMGSRRQTLEETRSGRSIKDGSTTAWVELRRCSRRGSGSVETPGTENPFVSRTSMYFLRHGESEWNKAQANMDAIGMLSDVDHPLDETGITQCKEFNQKWRDEVKRRDDGAPADDEAGVQAADLDDFLSADAIYASPLCRATQTCLIGLDGHPALRADAAKPQVTMLSSARELKKVGGMDTVGGHVGDGILDNVKAQTSRVLGQDEVDKIMGHVVADPYDAMDTWWTGGDDRDTDQDMQARFYSFVSSLRYSHRSGLSNKPTIVVGHSLFMREFCRYFMDPDVAEQDPIAMQLTQSKLANACMVKLDLEFDDEAMDEIVRIVGVTPMFGLKFHTKKDAVKSRRAGSSLAGLCCCLKPAGDDATRKYDNPMAGDDDEEEDDQGESRSELRMSRRTLPSASEKSPRDPGT